MNGMTIEYGNTSYPTYLDKILTVNYYDTYPTGTPTIPTQVLGQDVLTQDAQNSSISTKSLPVASYVKNIEDDNWTKDYIWYDTQGRAIGTHSVNHLGGYTKTEAELDFTGVPKKTNTYHVRKMGEIGVIVKERFVYDPQYRLLQHYHQVDNNPEELLTENTYNELSQLKNKKVGNNLQSIDYAYNIRGWMTEINKDQMSLPDLGGKLFSYKIKYNQKDGITNPDNALFSGKDVKPKFNGNIAEVDWRAVENIGNNPSTTPKRYGYAYDNLNRLTAGYYQNPNNPYSKENTESLAYDLNGNISTLYRTSVLESPSNTPNLIDNLQYTYAAGDNKLTSINDNSQNPTGYEGGGNLIGYDLNGNMTSMPDKNIKTISYNFLDLPKRIEYGNGGIAIDYKYSADGIKLQKVSPKSECGIIDCYTVTDVTDYLDGFQYLKSTMSNNGGGSPEMLALSAKSARAMEQQAFSLEGRRTPPPAKTADLQFFPTEEGFYDYTKNQYIYQYKDQIGNARISFGRNSAGVLEITDNNDYYPFGMNHLKTGSAYFGQASYKNYKYQEQELQETGFYSFKWRNYMPDVGRFFNVDPLSETYAYQSHYNFSENRVVDARELEGLEMKPINSAASFEGMSFDGGVEKFESFANGEKGALIQEIVLDGGSKSNFTVGDAVRTGAGFVPIVGSGLDMYEGARDGNWVQFGFGVGGLALDIATLGAGSVIKGGVKTLGTHLVEEGMEKAAKEVAESVVENETKNLALGLDDDLFTFAEHHGFDTYRDFSSGFQEDKILDAMNSYDKIHFNTTGFGKVNFSRFKPDAPLSYRNFTNWEMHTIMNNPTLLKKTTFYNQATNGGYKILDNYSPFFK
jgi:RHS repeat-associated protein